MLVICVISLYNNENSVTVKVQAIIRGKEGQEMMTNGSGYAVNKALVDLVIEKNKNSKIVEAQMNLDYNILTNQLFDETTTKDMMLGYFGAETIPMVISIYPQDFDSKEAITDYLDKYNEGKEEEDVIEYLDMASMISSLSGGIMDAITIVLIAFSSISLIVSSIMIGIITYISVLERTKEIGVLRAIGASKKNISSIFNAETFIVGFFSGVIGIGTTLLLLIPTNHIIHTVTNNPDITAVLPWVGGTILVILSVILTLIGGLIPSKHAAKKDPVLALRSE